MFDYNQLTRDEMAEVMEDQSWKEDCKKANKKMKKYKKKAKKKGKKGKKAKKKMHHHKKQIADLKTAERLLKADIDNCKKDCERQKQLAELQVCNKFQNYLIGIMIQSIRPELLNKYPVKDCLKISSSKENDASDLPCN